MADFKVRDFKPSDFEEVESLWKETGMGGAERGDNLEIISGSLKIGGRLLILEQSGTGKIAGTSWMTFDGRRIHLHHFGIHPVMQGKGLSKILLAHSLKHVRDKGFQVKIEVHKDNFRALNLYRQYGFKYLGDYDVHIIRDITTINKFIDSILNN